MVPLKKKASRAWRWLALLPIPLAWCAAAHFGGLDVLESQFLRLRYLYRGEIAAPVKIIYVDVDTRANQEMGERPWDRAEFGRAAQTVLEAGHAKAVGFDFVFSDFSASKMVPREEIRKRDVEFARIIRKHPEIVLGAQYSGGQGYLQDGLRQFPLLRLGFRDRKKNDLPELPIYPLIGPTWGTVGLIDVDYGYGGSDVPRWVPVFAETPNPTFYHLALKLAMIDLGLDDSAVRIGKDRLDLVRPDGARVASIPLQQGQLLEVNWFSRWANPRLNPRTSMADVLLYREDLASDKPGVREAAQRYFTQFDGAIVLIGPVDPLLQDLAPTPFDPAPVPKVGLHGNLIKTIRSGLFLRQVSEATGVGLTFLLTIGTTALAVAGGARGVRYKVFGAVLLAAFVALCLILFKSSQLVLPMSAPLGAAFTTSFVAVGWQLVEEEKQKGRIKGMFGTYLAPTVVNSMIESGKDPELGGHDAEITAYFSDIQSFSSFSEVMSSAKLTELLNEYLTACTDIVQGEGGTLDKYIGDAVVAMFGAPIDAADHAFRACVVTQLVQKRIGELREKWRSEGDKWPGLVHRLRTRIGLNTGVCMIGNMGSRTRFNYTMMGDNVNLAARMESGAKSWGAYTMCTETTKLACEKHGEARVVFRPLGKIVVKGRSQAVPIFEIVGLKEDVPDQARECIDLFRRGLESYYARDWNGALA
ncbi:MAG TPA: adenylate/guanylate cyclase domain-containing protein, partial [Opitutus sp.]|nr:adenylate/guanylate cyclase domain-containing protein [Opitutus sp.]